MVSHQVTSANDSVTDRGIVLLLVHGGVRRRKQNFCNSGKGKINLSEATEYTPIPILKNLLVGVATGQVQV